MAAISIAGNTISNSNQSTGISGGSNGYVLTTTGVSSAGAGSITFVPNNNYYTWSGTSINAAPDTKYYTFKLPINKLPEAVYVAGRMITLGIIGTDVECAYTGIDQLVFSPGVLSTVRYNDKITLILQYSDKMYHYNVMHMFGVPITLPDSKYIQTALLSEIPRDQK